MIQKILIFLTLLSICQFPAVAQQEVAMADSIPVTQTDTLPAEVIIEPVTPVLDTDCVEQPETVAADSVVTDSVVQPSPEALIKKDKKKPVKIRPSVMDSVATTYALRMRLLNEKYTRYRYLQPDTLANPYYFYVFAQPTFYGLPMHQMIGMLSPSTPLVGSDIYTFPSLKPQGTVAPNELLGNISKALSAVYTETPQLITQNEESHLTESGIRNDVNKEVKPKVKLTDKVETKEEIMKDSYCPDDWNIVVYRPNFWTFKANLSLQLMQYFVSDNWYKGGENNYSWLAESILEANYNNKQKITFDNKLEMRLGFQSSKGDDKHKFRSNSDLLRLTNKLGLKATKHWYYTLMLQSWTQFYPGYKKNDEKVYSDFMSPFESIFSLGMDYKLNLKKFVLTATISPLAGSFKYVDREALAPSFGLEKDKNTKFDFGSNITCNYNWNIMKNVSWSGRVFFFTDYETTRIEWENTFNLKINKFLSTKIYLYPRFDDGVHRKEGQSYYQFKETLSLGFDYRF